MERVRRAFGRFARRVHHVGGTSVPGFPCSPILDLLAEVESLEQLVGFTLRLLAHGFEAAGSHPDDCRFYVVDDILTGERKVELRCYSASHPETRRIPALFALLRARPDLARAYYEAKLDALLPHAADLTAYEACKRAWLDRFEGEAMSFWEDVRE